MLIPLKLVRDQQLQQQIFDQLRDLIVSKRLRPGSRMPSSRMMAEQFAISRMTVLLTYERLIAEGYVETRPAAGTFVARPPDRSPALAAVDSSALSLAHPLADPQPALRTDQNGTPPRVRTGMAAPDAEGLVGAPDPSLFPAQRWRSLMRAGLDSMGTHLTTDHPSGHPGLREAIASWLSTSRGLAVTAEQVMLVKGRQQALHIAAHLASHPCEGRRAISRAMARPGGGSPAGNTPGFMAEAHSANGDPANGDRTNGDRTNGYQAEERPPYGNLAQGNLAQGNVAQGNLAHGHLAAGNPAEGHPADNHLLNGLTADGYRNGHQLNGANLNGCPVAHQPADAERIQTRIVVEDPCDAAAAAGLAMEGSILVRVPADADGLCTDRLPEGDAVLIHVTPEHQRPSGVVLSRSRRIALLEWAERAGALILEEDIDGELRYGTMNVPSLMSLDRSERVILLGGFSVSMGPWLNVAFMVLPSWLMPFARAMRLIIDDSHESLEQGALAGFLEGGGYARHLHRLSKTYASRRDALVAALRRHFGGSTHVWGEHAGLHLTWFPPPEIGTPVALAGLARRYGLHAAASRDTILLGFGMPDEHHIEAGFRNLAEALVGAREAGQAGFAGRSLAVR